MPRPISRRSVAEDLVERVFKPQAVPSSELETVTLTLDGLEALRLVDLEGLYQEAAAERMGVSRATFARVLLRARQAVSEALVEGRLLAIEGGEIRRRRGRGRGPCPVHGSGGRRGRGCRCAATELGKGRGRGRGREEERN